MVFREAFDTGSFWTDIDEHGCTFTLVVPAMAHWLLAQPPTDADRSHALRYALLSPVVPGFADRFGVSVRTHYGMTEAGNVMSRRDVRDVVTVVRAADQRLRRPPRRRARLRGPGRRGR